MGRPRRASSSSDASDRVAEAVNASRRPSGENRKLPTDVGDPVTCHGPPPSGRMPCTCVVSVRSERNPSQLPSGAQRGEPSSAGSWVSRVASPVSTWATHRSLSVRWTSSSGFTSRSVTT